jgi:hypothetical protein
MFDPKASKEKKRKEKKTGSTVLIRFQDQNSQTARLPLLDS